MSVADCLGLTEHSELLAQADQAWPAWCARYPVLDVAADTAGLRSWLKKAVTADADEVLLALAQLAAPDGDNDVAAAATLAWALMPGACTLANRLRTLSPEIDQIVAGQLWLEVRTFPWRRLTKVSSNILLNTRAGTLRECGAQSQLVRSDPTWSRTVPLVPYGPFWDGQAATEPGGDAAAEELFQLLEWACEHDVITETDRSLLVCLVEAADRATTTRVGRSRGGLMANETTEQVASQLGMSASTLRRRTRQSIDALAEACTHPKASA
ncbi:hypothetical protein ATK17_3756 [Branchiibius hedensis]|uniref:Uncharacterized protein n=1 Tax=Branchiibius hedensis TaxID=672460 RepID=A0A2Y9BPX0_9MICO|nr:hypothetical protein [Branchiibius hedensis]PWJ23263.1 hypothetical protein ATK17_3756 [Branchiibius hedensis]SSA58952.1 hypothetical protein SAMN04489750_3756 [Branchiibius hedensis]